jgi:hypothetical protein
VNRWVQTMYSACIAHGRTHLHLLGHATDILALLAASRRPGTMDASMA